MKVLVICGSRRERSYSRVLARLAWDYARQKYADAELLDLGTAPVENFRGFEVEYQDETRAALDQVVQADVFVICSPIYNGSLSSGIKNLFEHINHKALEGRVAGFARVSEGRISYLQVHGQLQALMNYFRVISNPRAAYINQADFDESLNLVNQTMIKRMQRLVDETAGMKGETRTPSST